MGFFLFIISLISFQYGNYSFSFSTNDLTIPVGDSLTKYLDEVKASYYEDGVLLEDDCFISFGEDGTSITTITTDVVGEYTLVCKALANSHSEKFTLYIHVVDNIAPTIYIPSVIEIEVYTKNPDYEKFVNYSDNYNSKSELDLVIDASLVDINHVGSYDIFYTVIDLSNNMTTHKGLVYVIDDSPPIIYTPTIDTSYGIKPDFSLVEAKDNYDSHVEVFIDDSEINIYESGNYDYYVRATDVSGNENLKKGIVRVLDNREYKIILYSNTLLLDVGLDKSVLFDNIKGIYKGDEEIFIDTFIDDSNVCYEKEGIYSAFYILNLDNNLITKEVSIRIRRKREDTNFAPPIITGDDQVLIGDVFDPLKYVNAYDYLGNDISKNIIIKENTVNLETPGLYYVLYEVYDSYGNFSSKKIYFRIAMEEDSTKIPVFVDEDIQKEEKIDIFELIMKNIVYFSIGGLILLFCSLKIFKK